MGGCGVQESSKTDKEALFPVAQQWNVDFGNYIPLYHNYYYINTFGVCVCLSLSGNLEEDPVFVWENFESVLDEGRGRVTKFTQAL